MEQRGPRSVGLLKVFIATLFGRVTSKCSHSVEQEREIAISSGNKEIQFPSVFGLSQPLACC